MIEYLTSHFLYPFSINIIYLSFFLLINILIPIHLGYFFKISLDKSIRIIILNSLFFSIYLIYINFYGSDGLGFYRKPWLNEEFTFLKCGGIIHCVRDNFMIKIGLIFKDLKIHYLNATLFLNVFSCLAFILLYSKLKNLFFFKNFNFFLLIFVISIPGLLFWGNGLLKDNFILFAVAIFVVSVSQNSVNYKLIILAALICFFVRPLIALFIIMSVFLYTNIYLKYFKGEKTVLIDLLYLIILIISIIFTFHQYEISLSFNFYNDVLRHIEITSSSNQALAYLGSELNYEINTTNFQKFLNYYFGPLIFSSPIYILISIQNLINALFFIIFLVLILWKMDLFKKFIKELGYKNIFFIYLILYNLVIPITNYNYGIALRQKWMSLIIFYYLFFLFISFFIERIKKNK